jgi:hypothetical protein
VRVGGGGEEVCGGGRGRIVAGHKQEAAVEHGEWERSWQPINSTRHMSGGRLAAAAKI